MIDGSAVKLMRLSRTIREEETRKAVFLANFMGKEDPPYLIALLNGASPLQHLELVKTAAMVMLGEINLARLYMEMAKLKEEVYGDAGSGKGVQRGNGAAKAPVGESPGGPRLADEVEGESGAGGGAADNHGSERS